MQVAKGIGRLVVNLGLRKRCTASHYLCRRRLSAATQDLVEEPNRVERTADADDGKRSHRLPEAWTVSKLADDVERGLRSASLSGAPNRP